MLAIRAHVYLRPAHLGSSGARRGAVAANSRLRLTRRPWATWALSPVSRLVVTHSPRYRLRESPEAKADAPSPWKYGPDGAQWEPERPARQQTSPQQVTPYPPNEVPERCRPRTKQPHTPCGRKSQGHLFESGWPEILVFYFYIFFHSSPASGCAASLGLLILFVFLPRGLLFPARLVLVPPLRPLLVVPAPLWVLLWLVEASAGLPRVLVRGRAVLLQVPISFRAASAGW